MGQKGGAVMIQRNKRRSTFEVLKEMQEYREIFKDRPDQEIWVTPEEAARLLGRERFTVSEWCRLGKVHARKQRSGRWQISFTEIERYLREGLLQDKQKYRYVR